MSASSTTTSNKTVDKKPLYDFIKRLLDILISFVSLIFLLPIFIIIGIAIKSTSKGKVFFTHKRVGKNGKPIGIYKFRSMVENAEELMAEFTEEQKAEFSANYKLHDDPRITKVGNFLRKTSLDELPQLLNILKGDLSIVGPRPIIEEETKMYGKYKDMLLSVKPGLTGFWAANGRSNIPYSRRRAMEIYYVKNRSLALDITIIFKTFLCVFKKVGAK